MSGSTTPLVSVILPAYNAARFIEASIASVRQQSFPALELIVVDDGSTDDTATRVAKAARQDPRIRLLRQRNSGVAAARNHAAGCARAPYIAPLDADDIWFPEKLEKQVRCMQRAAANVGVVYAWSVRIDAAGKVFNRRPRPELRGWLYPAFAYKNFCSASAPLIRRECLLEAGGYDLSLRAQGGEGCEDLDLLLRLAQRYDFELIPEFLLGYRVWEGSMSCNAEAMERSHHLVMQRVEQTCPDLPRRILRWSRSEFCLHLATKCRRGARPAGVWKYLLKAVRHDPGLLRFFYVYRLAMQAAAAPFRQAASREARRTPAAAQETFRVGRRERELQARVDYVRRYSAATRPGQSPGARDASHHPAVFRDTSSGARTS